MSGGATITRKVRFVSGNPRKIEEINAIINDSAEIQTLLNAGLKIVVETVRLDLPEIQGSSAEIVKAKIAEACRVVDGPVLVEDVSLCCSALGGMPGPYVKHFLSCMPRNSLYRLLNGFTDKSTTAICTLGYTEGKGETIHTFEGRVSGEMVIPKGENLFGWDPMFQPDGATETFAEMAPEKKNKISHRALALKMWAEFLKQQHTS